MSWDCCRKCAFAPAFRLIQFAKTLKNIANDSFQEASLQIWILDLASVLRCIKFLPR